MAALQAFSEAAAASAGGFFSCFTLYPIEICKNKMQTMKADESQGTDEEGAPKTFFAWGKHIVKTEVRGATKRQKDAIT